MSKFSAYKESSLDRFFRGLMFLTSVLLMYNVLRFLIVAQAEILPIRVSRRSRNIKFGKFVSDFILVTFVLDKCKKTILDRFEIFEIFEMLVLSRPRCAIFGRLAIVSKALSLTPVPSK